MSQKALFTRQKTLVEEISRDPVSADLLFTLFSSAVGTEFLDPRTPMPKDKTLEKIVQTMPSMRELAKCSNDTELKSKVGSESFDVLHCAILECPSAYALLPESLEIPEFRRQNTNDNEKCYQFAVIESPPEKEHLFQLCKEKAKGSIYLTHGSIPERWHQINREELRDMSKTPRLVLNGSTYGPGISLSPKTDQSIAYGREMSNKYPKSELGSKISIVCLCEVANLPNREEVSVKVDDNKTLTGELRFHEYSYTLTLEEACIIRYLFVNLDSKVDTLNNQTVINHLQTKFQ